MFSRSLHTLKRAPVARSLRSSTFATTSLASTSSAKLHTSSPPLVRPGRIPNFALLGRQNVTLKSVLELSPCCRPAGLAALQARGAASSVTNKPGSQTPAQAAQNIKEEVGNTAGSVARVIAGGSIPIDRVKPVEGSFLGITSAVANAVPKPALVLGLAGGLPYVGTAATVVYLARQAGLSAAGYSIGMDPGVAITVLDQALNIQMTYGAVMLSFLGALHWGMEFAGYDGQKGYPRLLLGVAPVLAGWSTLALDPTMALIGQWVAFTGLWWADLRATNAGWTPKWYSQYRFYLSILVGTCIIGTLAGTSYWGPVGGHGFETRELQELRGERKRHQAENFGTVAGQIAAETSDNADSFVMLKKNEEKKENGGKDEKKDSK